MNKRVWLDAAEIVDSLRVVPRIVLFGYCYWLGDLVNNIITWYQMLPAPERTLEASGLAGTIITAVTGIAAWVFKIYTAGGRDWSTETEPQPEEPKP